MIQHQGGVSLRQDSGRSASICNHQRFSMQLQYLFEVGFFRNDHSTGSIHAQIGRGKSN